MKNFYAVFFFFLYSVLIFAKNPDENCRIIYPKHIPVNSSFDISLIISNDFPEADDLEVFILSDEKIYLKKSDIRTTGKIAKINFSSSEYEDFSGPVNKININLKDSLLSSVNYFQLLFSFESENINNSIVKFSGSFKSKDSVIGYLHPDKVFSEEENFITADLTFYKPQKIAGSSLLLNNNSFFKVSVKDEEIKNLLTEFWIKLNNSESSFLKIKHKNNPLIEFDLFTNTSQMLLIGSPVTPDYLNPSFLGRKSWYYISISVSSENDLISFYCNGTLVGKYHLQGFSQPEDFLIEFFNEQKNKNFQIDFLRFIDLRNSSETFYESGSFLSFISDSSRLKAQFKFESRDEIISNEKILEISENNIQYIKSDAPLFAKAPELNINILSSSFELEWTGGDYKQANSYILEKSSGSNEYIPLFTIQAENSLEKVYRFFDKSEESSDVIYYRVKQINLDGTVVYSSQVKVGQGFMDPFLIEQNFPNPFNPKTSINFELLEDMEIEITVYNLEGRKIDTLHKGFLTKGNHTFIFDGTELPSGIYLYKIAAQGFSQTRKMILTK